MNGGITARDWNAMVRELWRKLNVEVLVLDSGAWQHPWQITPSFNGDNWEATINPGFINGRDPTISVSAESAPAATVERYKRNSSTFNPQPSTFNAFLTEEPKLQLTSFRRIGPGSIATGAETQEDGSLSFVHERVPDFFKALGVGDPPAVTGDLLDGIVRTEASGETRLLRALDVILTQPRMATEAAFQMDNATASTIFQYDITTKNTAAIRQRARISTLPKYTPPNPQDPLQQLQGIWADDGMSTLHLATVWFVSQPGADLTSDPDASWTPYVEHKVFWNLDFNTNQLPDALKNENLTLNTGLALGTGDRINQFYLSQINDANSAIAQFLGRSTIEGVFWSV